MVELHAILIDTKTIVMHAVQQKQRQLISSAADSAFDAALIFAIPQADVSAAPARGAAILLRFTGL